MRTYGVNFDLLKAFVYIKRVVKSDFFSFRKRPLSHQTCATCSELPTYISTMIIIMVFILDGCSLHAAHVWCKQGLSSKRNRIWRLFRYKQMPSTNRNAWFTQWLRIFKWATIYYTPHEAKGAFYEGEIKSNPDSFSRVGSHRGCTWVVRVGNY